MAWSTSQDGTSQNPKTATVRGTTEEKTHPWSEVEMLRIEKSRRLCAVMVSLKKHITSWVLQLVQQITTMKQAGFSPAPVVNRLGGKETRPDIADFVLVPVLQELTGMMHTLAHVDGHLDE